MRLWIYRPQRSPVRFIATFCSSHARRLRAEIEELPGLDHAVELLERLAIERTPLIA